MSGRQRLQQKRRRRIEPSVELFATINWRLLGDVGFERLWTTIVQIPQHWMSEGLLLTHDRKSICLGARHNEIHDLIPSVTTHLSRSS